MMLTVADVLTTLAKSVNPPTVVCLYLYCIELCLTDVFLQTCTLHLFFKTPIWGKLSMPRNHGRESD